MKISNFQYNVETKVLNVSIYDIGNATEIGFIIERLKVIAEAMDAVEIIEGNEKDVADDVAANTADEIPYG